MSIPFNKGSAAFNAIYQVGSARAAELNSYENTILQHGKDSDDGIEASIVNLFIEACGSDSNQKTTNSTATEIEKVNKDCGRYINKRFNIGRERRFNHNTIDVLFMRFTVFKNGGTKELLAAILKLELSSFYCLNSKCFENIFYLDIR